MFITTEARFEWDKDKKEYVEVYTEGYEYEGELELAHTTGTMGDVHWHDPPSDQSAESRTNTFPYSNNYLPYTPPNADKGSNYGSQEWNPNENYLLGATGRDIAKGFDLDAKDYGMYFQPFDPWKSAFAAEEKNIATASLENKYGEEGFETIKTQDLYDTASAGITRKGTEADTELSAAFGTAKGTMQTSWIDSSSQIEARNAQAGFTGRGMGRKDRQVAGDLSRAYTQTTEASTRAHDVMLADLDQKQVELDIGKIYDDANIEETYTTGMDTADVDYRKSVASEAKGYIDDIYDTLGQLAAADAWGDD